MLTSSGDTLRSALCRGMVGGPHHSGGIIPLGLGETPIILGGVNIRLPRIGPAQINAIVCDPEGNTRRIIESIDQAKALQVDVVAFPELVVTGYPPEDLLLKADLMELPRIGLAQVNAIGGDLEGNTRRIIDGIDRARELQLEVVAFPELGRLGGRIRPYPRH